MSENSKTQQANEQDHSKKHSAENDLRENAGSQNASANSGGTTDMDEEALTTGRRNATERGSGASTKNAVTGSDFDGQVSNG